ncbi:Leucine Rich repeats (2 copies) [compost metagenome]
MHIEFQKNRLTEFKVTGCPAVKLIRLGDNQLSKLDFSKFSELEELSLRDNPLVALDIYGLRKLKSLDCSYTRLTNVNMSGTVSLGKMEW